MKNIIFLFAILFNLSSSFGQGYLCLIGGGTENYGDWSDEPYSWIVEKSDSGKILILFYDDKSDWLKNYFLSFGAYSAENIKIDSRELANSQSIYNEIITAKAIFLPGGDQYQYIRLWKGTKVEVAINSVFNSGGVIGGTSAGAMVLGSIDFSAKNGTVYPDEALINPNNNYMQFEHDFLKTLNNFIIDTHFEERARFGRMLGFLINLKLNNSIYLNGIGIDDLTAACIEPNGNCEILGSGSVWFFNGLSSGSINGNFDDYIVQDIELNVLTNKWKINLNNLEVTPPESSKLWEINNTSISSNPIFLTGHNENFNNIKLFFQERISENSSSLIIYNQGFSYGIEEIINFFVQNNLTFETLEISNSTINNLDEVWKINESENIIVAGNSLSKLSLLNDTTTVLGDALRNRISQNANFIFLGESANLLNKFLFDDILANPQASLKGLLKEYNGYNFSGFINIQPDFYGETNYYRNKTAALLYQLMRNGNHLAVPLFDEQVIEINPSEKTVSKYYSSFPLVIFNTRNSEYKDSSNFILKGYNKPRQTASITNLTINAAGKNQVVEFNFNNGFSHISNIKNYKDLNITDQFAFDIFPNPFNNQTKLSVNSISKDYFTIKIYNILGEEIFKKNYGPLNIGINTYNLNFSELNLPSGIYLISLQNQSATAIKKLVYQK